MEAVEGVSRVVTRFSGIPAALAVFALAALLYSVNLDRFVHFDEIYHILAARGILETGEPRIENGFYQRAFWYTWGLSKAFSFAGDELAVARVPSVIAVASVAGLLYYWIRNIAGAATAFTVSLLYAISPFAVDTALFARFYGVQALFFLSLIHI